MKKVIKYLKENWHPYPIYIILGLGIAWYIYTHNWHAVIWNTAYLLLYIIMCHLLKEIDLARVEITDLALKCVKQNSMLREMHDKYAQLSVKYYRLRKKYEPEELVKEISATPNHKRRTKRWQKKDTPMSK